ncbi:MAG: hypothetical protein D6785_04855, partial [Planctomycetota bacterium]
IIVEKSPQDVWDNLTELEDWSQFFSFVLSSHAMEDPKKPDQNIRGMVRQSRTLYLKGWYRGKMARMLFDAEISGNAKQKNGGAKNGAHKKAPAPAKSIKPGAPSAYRSGIGAGGYGRRAYFRGGTIRLKGPINNISGNPFIPLKDFVQLSLSLRTSRMYVKGRPKTATQVTIQISINYQKLFLADRDINLFRLDYRSSEFDRQFELGLHKIAEEFRNAL